VIRDIQRPTPQVVEALGAFGVATIHEAYGRLGLMDPAIRPIRDGLRLCGPAVTSLNQPGDNLMVHAAIDVCRPGDVLVVTTTEPSTHGMVGELLATQARARGLGGMVLDTGVRDVAALQEMGFPVWSRAISALGTTKEKAGWVNVPVLCAGVTVNPGDIVVADDDGVVVVAAADAARVAEAAAAREARESVLRERYAGGESSLDVGGLRKVLARLGVEDA
jgi:4-hydroxy-4-methyl-2-oxoglutarate aldolase